MEYIKAIFSLLFPTKNLCYLCIETSETINDYICIDCTNLLDIVHREVRLDSPFIDRVYYTLIYNRYMRDIVKDFKFNKKSYLYKPLGVLMLKTISEKNINKDVDLILYIPSHRRKEAKRGYNQAYLISKELSKIMQLPEESNFLIRTKNTPSQSLLHKDERHNNIKNAFKVTDVDNVQGKKILLIDDVLTTGSTLNECSRVLKEAGADKVDIAVIAVAFAFKL